MADSTHSLLRQLQSTDLDQRYAARNQLLAIGADALRAEPGVVAALTRMLGLPDPSTRITVAHLMGWLDIEAARAAAILLELVGGTETELRARAILAFTNFDQPPANLVPILVSELASPSARLIMAAKQLLATIGGPAVPALCAAMPSAGTDVRRRTAATLGGMRQRYARAVYRLTASDVKWPASNRRAGAEAYLSRTRDHLVQIFRTLLGALKDPNPGVVFCVERALDYGSITRIPREVLGEYLAVLPSIHPWSVNDAIAEALAHDDLQVRDLAVSVERKLATASGSRR